MSENNKSSGINLFSPLGITIALAITVPIFTVLIFALYFPKTWDATILKLGLARDSATTAKQSQAITPSPSQNKPVELMEVLDTPVGGLPIVKYVNDSCLYAKATTTHTNYYGTSQLKSQLKKRYQVQCVLWN